MGIITNIDPQFYVGVINLPYAASGHKNNVNVQTLENYCNEEFEAMSHHHQSTDTWRDHMDLYHQICLLVSK